MGSNLKFLGFKFEIHRIPSKQGTAIRLSAALYFDAGRDPFLHRLDQVPIEADHPPSSRSDAAIAVQAARIRRRLQLSVNPTQPAAISP